MLNRSRALGLTEEKARLISLLSLIAHLDDTCILHRGGPDANHSNQHGSQAKLRNILVVILQESITTFFC